MSAAEPGTRWKAQIVARDTGAIYWSSPPTSRHDADRIARGASINLNHDRYMTRVVAA